MASAYKETGSWTSFVYVGVQGGLDSYCLARNINATSAGLILASAQLDANAVGYGSEIVVNLYLDGASIGKNFQFSLTSGGFYTSASGAQTVPAGLHSIQICVGGAALVSWTPYFSINALI